MKLQKIAYYSIAIHVVLVILVIGFFIKNNELTKKFDTHSMAASSNMVLAKNELENSQLLEELLPSDLESAPASIQKSNAERYDEMSIEQLEEALYGGTLPMEYSAFYTYSGNRLSQSKGALYFNGHKETYYSEKVLPGPSLNIPGRHVADDGTIRDGDGFICVAADPAYLPKYSILITSVGPAKVYDSGCDYGIIDIYVSW